MIGSCESLTKDHMHRFSWITAPDNQTPAAYEQPVLRSHHFVALPTIGALVEGWLLVVPRRDLGNLSLLATAEKRDLAEQTAELSLRLQVYGMPVYQFEHGSLPGQDGACGVDHAHLHLVPLPFDLYDLAVCERDVRWEELPKTASPWEHALPGREYLAIRAPDGRSAIGYAKQPTSQWFRRLIASALGRPDEWNYRTHSALELIDATAKRVGASREQQQRL